MSKAASDQAYQTLAAYLRGGRLPHAMLVEGGSPRSRMAFARRAAQGALCEADRADRPCGTCRHCVKADKEIHPDILVYGSEGGARSFHIDTVRELRGQAFVRPNEAEGKAFLLENVQDMSVQAQNALLKIIEEPPVGVVFLLCCANKAAMLETILSRVAVCSLGEASPGEETSLEAGEAPAGTEPAAQTDFREQALAVLLALAGHREMDALEQLSRFERDREGLRGLLEAMRSVVTGLLVPAAGGRPASGEEDLENLSKRLGRLQMMSIVAIIDDTVAAVLENANGLLLTTAFCARVKRAL